MNVSTNIWRTLGWVRHLQWGVGLTWSGAMGIKVLVPDTWPLRMKCWCEREWRGRGKRRFTYFHPKIPKVPFLPINPLWHSGKRENWFVLNAERPQWGPWRSEQGRVVTQSILSIICKPPETKLERRFETEFALLEVGRTGILEAKRQAGACGRAPVATIC